MSGIWAMLPASASVAIWAMIVASLLPLLFAYTAKALGGFRLSNNADPRSFMANLTGAAARAHAAEKNSYETLPIFLAAVIVAMLFFVPQYAINQLAWMYVLIRLGFGLAYILNLPTFRSVLWALSMACVLLLFYLALRLAS